MDAAARATGLAHLLRTGINDVQLIQIGATLADLLSILCQGYFQITLWLITSE